MSTIVAQGMLTVQVDGEHIPVAPCQVDNDGGIFVAEEGARQRGGTMTFRRIGTLSKDTMKLVLDESVDVEEEPEG